PANMRLGSVGKAMPSIDIKIENAGEDNIGEIIAKGPNVMLGYYENPELTEQVMRGGYFHTGDLGYLDKDGYLFITGRLKNVIVLENGKNVYPEELEFYISQLDYVKEILVTNKKENGRDKITATVVVDTDEISVAEARKLFENDVKGINKRLANYKQIKDFEVTDKEFIKTTTGKIKRNIQK
ncbi:MAG: AMP-binding protein, partial [Bacillota bacterium]|nr:AMP-binding protein [Bacillota bacterium]